MLTGSLLFASLALASERRDTDEILGTLQQIQGRWRGDCRPIAPAGGVGYEETRLVVSFTHFAFSTTEYSDADCRLERGRWQSKYRFVLGPPLATSGGTTVFAIDFTETEDRADRSTLAAQDLIRYRDGILWLGLGPAEPPGARLQHIDEARPFFR